MKRTDEWIRDGIGRGHLVKAYRVGELIVHRKPTEMDALQGMTLSADRWTISHARSGAAVAHLQPNTNHREALGIAAEMDAAADRLWPKIGWGGEQPTPTAAIKAAGEMTLDIRNRLANERRI